MTQAFCHIALNYSTARLSWATIKSLHRHRNHECEVKPVEYEILMGWTLLAFHSIYVSSGVEHALRFIVPFYYYFKLLAIMATFVVPVLISLNPFHFRSAERSVSNPLVAAWFNCLIVPCVQRIHEMMDHDPKKWAGDQLAFLPLLFLDYFILPGIFLTDEERETVRICRSDQSWTARKKCAVLSEDQHDPSIIPSAILFQRDDTLPFQLKHDQAPKVESNDATTRTSLNSSFRQCHIQVGPDQPAARPTDHPLSPPNQRRTTSLFNDDALDNAASFFWRTTPSSTAEASSSLYVTSPVAKSRVVSSSLRLRRFSREHESSRRLTPRLHGPVSSDVNDITKEVVRSEKKPRAPDTCSNSEKEEHTSSTVILPSNENKSPNSATDNVKAVKKHRHKRVSLGDHFRELLTGDANIRVRDHLFDLELPLVPCPSPRKKHGLTLDTSRSPPRSNTGKSNVCKSRRNDFKTDGMKTIDSSRITTRRSSRLSKTSSGQPNKVK